MGRFDPYGIYGPGDQVIIRNLGGISVGHFKRNTSRQGKDPIALPPSSLFGCARQHIHRRKQTSYMGDYLLGPWEGAKKAQNLGQEVLGITRITSERLTTEETKTQIDAEIATSVLDSTAKSDTKKPEEKAKTTTITTEKPSVIKLDKEKRHDFEVKDGLLIQIDDTCWHKMHCWINMTEKEISGLGCVRQEKNGVFHIYDVFLFEQENTYNFTDIDDLAVQKLMVELDDMDEKDGGSRFQDLKFWWHSHGNYDVKWSPQDDFNIQEKLFGENEESKPICPWWLSIVLNKKGAVATRLDIAEPWLTMNRVAYKIQHYIDPSIKEFCKAEYKKKVREKVSTTTTPSTQQSFGYQDYSSGHKTGSYYRKGSGATTGTQKTGTVGNGFVGGSTAGATNLQSTLNKNKTTVIPSPERNGPFQSCTVEEAYRLWEKEIIDGMAWLYSMAIEQGVNGVSVKAAAYRPTRIDGVTTTKVYDATSNVEEEIDNEYEWSVAGELKRGDYVLAIWPGGNSMHLSKLTNISEANGTKRASLCSRIMANDKWAKLGLECNPNWAYVEKSYERVACIIFSTKTAIPADLLDDIFLFEESMSSELDDPDKPEQKKEAFGKDWKDNDDWEEDWNEEKSKTKADQEEEKAKEEMDLYDEICDYAKRSHRSSVLLRINDWLDNMDNEMLADVVEILGDNFRTQEIPEAALDANSSAMGKEELLELATILIDMDPVTAMAEIFILQPAKNYCCGCYEPLNGEPDQCPQCKMHLAWGEE